MSIIYLSEVCKTIEYHCDFPYLLTYFKFVITSIFISVTDNITLKQLRNSIYLNA